MTTSISDAELAALLADLTTPTTPAPAPAADRCTVTELLTTECAHCRPATTPGTGTKLGPWFAASHNGKCAGCGGHLEEGDRIRADGDGGYLGDCCGNVDPATAHAIDAFELAGFTVTEAPAEQPQAATPAPVATPPAPRVIPDGPPPSTVALMRDVLADLDASRPRSRQTTVGPSELGTPCQRQLAMKLGGVPRQLPDSRPPWAPMQGTAIHGLMEEALHLHNQQLGYQRWVVEERLHMDDEISGSGDAFDLDLGMVVDWKFVGTTALRDVKRKTVPNHHLVKQEYRIQAHLYGYGHERAGRDVRWVRLVFLARSHQYDDSAEWTEAYNPTIAINALTRYYATQDLINALDVANKPEMWDLVPAEPGKACTWCPFRRVGGPADGTGCPGDTQTKIDKQLSGLIA